jgi:hypothetical protein
MRPTTLWGITIGSVTGFPPRGRYWLPLRSNFCVVPEWALGVVRGAELEIDTLAERLRKEAVANGSCLPAPRNGWVYRAQTVASRIGALLSSVPLHRVPP